MPPRRMPREITPGPVCYFGKQNELDEKRAGYPGCLLFLCFFFWVDEDPTQLYGDYFICNHEIRIPYKTTRTFVGFRIRPGFLGRGSNAYGNRGKSLLPGFFSGIMGSCVVGGVFFPMFFKFFFD